MYFPPQDFIISVKMVDIFHQDVYIRDTIEIFSSGDILQSRYN